MEQEFQIEIKEILSRIEPIRAGSLSEAVDKATLLYENQEIVLDAEDFKGVSFFPYK